MRFAASPSIRPHSLKNSLLRPKVPAPKQSSETRRPELPSSLYSMQIHSFGAFSLLRGCVIKLLSSALRAQISSYEAEAEGCGGSTVEADNEVWANLRRNPKGRGRFPSPQPAKLTGDPDFRSLRRSSFQ